MRLDFSKMAKFRLGCDWLSSTLENRTKKWHACLPPLTFLDRTRSFSQSIILKERMAAARGLPNVTRCGQFFALRDTTRESRRKFTSSASRWRHGTQLRPFFKLFILVDMLIESRRCTSVQGNLLPRARRSPYQSPQQNLSPSTSLPRAKKSHLQIQARAISGSRASHSENRQ